MNGSTHVAMTKAVLDAINWPGDRNRAARAAEWPDSAQVIALEKYGFHIIGKNLASLTHFCRPTSGGHYAGYCWMHDKSVPEIDLSDVKVIAHPEGWSEPIIKYNDLKLCEPFNVLVNGLIHSNSNIQADEITYSTCAIMGEWATMCYLVLAERLVGDARQEALDTILGIDEHLVAQDIVIPHHAMCVMLDGHSAFEGDVDEEFKRMSGNGELDALLATLVKMPVDKLVEAVTMRKIAESNAIKSVMSTRKLGFYRCFWRRGWNRVVRASTVRGITESVKVAKLLQSVI